MGKLSGFAICCALLFFVPMAFARPAHTRAAPAGFSGASAYDYAKAVVALGPRPPGSQAHIATELYIESQIKLHKAVLVEDIFTVNRPEGKVGMKNIIAKFPGRTGRAIVFSGHYDTKKLPHFWGANDGGSSTGFLLEMLRVLARERHPDDIYLVWFDGEEAFGEWSDADSLYGSKHLEEKWARDGTLSHIEAMFNVDMIGDADLGLLQDANSSQSLTKLVWDTARSLGYGKYFLDNPSPIEDDHLPFVRAGINAIDIIDLNYGPKNSYWHAPTDVMSKLSPHSFQVVGNVLMAVLKKLEAAPAR